MLKIESFSILSENPTITIESDVFEASGHKWRLDLYPNGNTEENGANHISLYLKMCDTQSLTKGWKVHVDVKFLAYDHIANNYVIFQDVDGNRTCFHENQMKWGFDKLISLEHFKDNSKGYLLNDSCVFGVEVFVVPEYTLKDRCLSMIKPLRVNTYSWTVDKFSAVTEKFLTSEPFKVGKLKWALKLYPKGDSAAGQNLSCYLKVHDARMFPGDWRVYAKYELRLKNQSGYTDRIKESSGVWFSKVDDTWGFRYFIPLGEFHDKTKGFLLNDKLILEAKISVVGILKDFI